MKKQLEEYGNQPATSCVGYGYHQPGITIIDLLAGMAMQGILSNPKGAMVESGYQTLDPVDVSKMAVVHATALLEALLEKEAEPKVDIRVVAEEEYQRMIKLLDRAENLVGNPATNISSGTDLACESWQKDYLEWKSKH